MNDVRKQPDQTNIELRLRQSNSAILTINSKVLSILKLPLYSSFFLPLKKKKREKWMKIPVWFISRQQISTISLCSRFYAWSPTVAHEVCSESFKRGTRLCFRSEILFHVLVWKESWKVACSKKSLRHWNEAKKLILGIKWEKCSFYLCYQGSGSPQ